MLIFSVNTLISLSGVGYGLGTFLISGRISLWSSGWSWTADFHASAFSVLRLQPESGAPVLFLMFFKIICVCTCLFVGHESKHLQSLEKGVACARVKQVTVRRLRMMLGTKLGSSEETFPSLNQWSISPAPQGFPFKQDFVSILIGKPYWSLPRLLAVNDSPDMSMLYPLGLAVRACFLLWGPYMLNNIRMLMGKLMETPSENLFLISIYKYGFLVKRNYY